jgi:phage-related protein
MADRISWIDSSGRETALSYTDNFIVLRGLAGRNMPPVSFIEEEIPFQAGSMLREVKVKSRDIDVPLLIKANSEMELRLKVRECFRIFNPLNGDGVLKVTSPDGSQREIYCRYYTGLEGREDKDNKGNAWQKVILVFRAFDPYWYDTNTIVQTFTTGEQATYFPFFPLRLSSSSVFADFSIDNVGDVESYPEWIIKGSGDNIVLRNLTTGELTNLDTSLGAGEIITIDTRPKKKSITKGDGTNLFGTQTDDNSSLWSLQSGVNNIRIEMSNASSESSVQLSYRPRYWGV